MAIEHKLITDSDIHEPKGVATAASGKVYVSDGAASGSWSYQVDYITVVIDDISTGQSDWVVSPYGGNIIKIYSVIDGAIGTGDANLSFEIGGVAITDGNIIITQSGSAAGDVDSSTPSALNTISSGQAIECITDGTSTNAVKAVITLVIQRT
jgi:hypothetical protein